MEDKTKLPEMTPPHLRVGGVAMIIATAAVPPMAWKFANDSVSLGGLFVALSAWAVIALVGYLGLGRSTEAKKFALLVVGCGALWSIVLSVGFWYVVRGAVGVDDPLAIGSALPVDEIMALFGVTAAATGATFGFFSGIRYRAIPNTFPRAIRAAAWASVPSVAMSLAVFSFQIANRYAAFAILAPFVLALAVTGVSQLVVKPQPETTPA
jgi:hypothetical protein